MHSEAGALSTVSRFLCSPVTWLSWSWLHAWIPTMTRRFIQTRSPVLFGVEKALALVKIWKGRLDELKLFLFLPQFLSLPFPSPCRSICIFLFKHNAIFFFFIKIHLLWLEVACCSSLLHLHMHIVCRMGRLNHSRGQVHYGGYVFLSTPLYILQAPTGRLITMVKEAAKKGLKKQKWKVLQFQAVA